MNIMVINFSGNTAKSTNTDTLLAPRLDNAEIVRVETINTHEGDDADNLKGKQYGDIISGLALYSNAVVDVGSSNSEDIVALMAQYEGSQEIFDLFVVPTVPHHKQIRDTIKTIEALSDLGIPAERIRLVFNMVEADSELEKVFAPLYAYHSAEGKFTLNPDAVIYYNDFYIRAAGLKTTVEKLVDDSTDFNKLLAAATTPEEKVEISQKRALKFLAVGLKKKLDLAFAATVKEV